MPENLAEKKMSNKLEGGWGMLYYKKANDESDWMIQVVILDKIKPSRRLPLEEYVP